MTAFKRSQCGSPWAPSRVCGPPARQHPWPRRRRRFRTWHRGRCGGTSALARRASAAEVAGQPVGARSSGRCEAEHGPGCQVHEDEDEVTSEPNVTSLEEVAAPDASRLVPEEGRPPLTAWRCAADSTDVPLDRAVGDGAAQLEELAANTLGAPKTVPRRHAPDERDRRGRQTRLCASLASGAP